MQVRMDLGAEGYGIFFMLIERLREEKEYKSTTNYKILEFDLKADSEKIKQQQTKKQCSVVRLI